MYGNGLCGSAYGWGLWSGPWMLFGLVLVLVAVTLLAGRGQNGRPERVVGRTDAALELLRRRYAAGELSEEDFQVMKDRLQA